MDINYFRDCMAFQLNSYKLTYSSHPNGDFGDLERVVIEGNKKVACIDFWSKGWLDIDIYDLFLDQQVMNILLEPTEAQKQEEAMKQLLGILLNEK